MKTTNRIYLLFHPLLLALYSFLIILYFTPDYFKKYDTEIVRTQLVGETSKEYFRDLDGDGISESLRVLTNRGAKSPAITYFDNSDKIINQWNLRGHWLVDQQLFFGDYNHNGYDEVYCITIVGDSLFLNAKELLVENGLEFEDKFICRTKLFNVDKQDVFVAGAITMDVNYDDKDEFVFTLFSGFSNQPRNAFVYDVASEAFTKSPLSASGFSGRMQFMDINNDGVEEITGIVSAVENIHYEMPYTDSCSWLMVLNPADSMNFLFSPIKFDGVYGGLEPVFCAIEGKKYIVTTFTCSSVGNSTNGIILKLFDINGKLLREKLVPYDDYGVLSIINTFNVDDNNIYFIAPDGKVFVSDTLLNIHFFSEPFTEGLVINRSKYVLLDIDSDGGKEILFIANRPFPDKLVIYRSSLKESTFVDLPESKQTLNWHVTLKNGAGKPPVIVLQTENIIYNIKYSISKYYLLKYPAFVCGYLLLLLIFWGLQKAQDILALRKHEAEKQLIRQQLTISKNQLEPHFMLNTLNNIGHMFAMENKEDAQYYFGRFASLIHRGLEYADKVETNLEEELKFIKDYLILQKRRFNDDLLFIIESEDEIDLDNIKIPHSLIFTFVENAIKHGLHNKPKDRKLSIYVKRVKNKITVTIIDNGIGRKQSVKLKTTGSGKGLGIVANIIEGYNKLNNRTISYKVIDLVDESGDGNGTEVRVDV